jgi:hypothetical protein
MMGHTNISTTQLYARVTDDKISEDIDKLIERRKTAQNISSTERRLSAKGRGKASCEGDNNEIQTA